MTRTRPGIAWVACTVLVGLLGWCLGRWQASPPSPEGTASTDTSDATPRGKSPGGSQSGPGLGAVSNAGTDLANATTRAANDPAYLNQLTQQYHGSIERDERGAVLAILASVANDEVLRFASQLMSSQDLAERRDGIDLLTGYPADRADVRDVLVDRLQNETDPELQARLLENLPSSQLPTEDAAPIAAELERLQSSDDPKVRAASTLQAVQWDRTGNTTDLLQRALLDTTPEVRQAGIAGIQVSRVRTPLLRDALLDIANNASIPVAERQAAIVALQDFPLNRAEFELYRRASGAIPKD